MKTQTTKEQLIAELRRTASANQDRPLGERAFFSETGLRKRQLWDVKIRTYGDLCELAGYTRNRMGTRLEPDQLFEPLALLTAELARFPNHTDLEIGRRSGGSLPSYEAYRNAEAKNGPVDRQLLEWCRSRPEHSQAFQIVEQHLSKQGGVSARNRRHGRIVKGYVYLFRYGNSGRDYKIGHTEDVTRRHSQISLMVPGVVKLVHVIETDDPPGIEKYWHNRFEDKLIDSKKEIFRLDSDDVAAFKSRKYQ